jgi:hypothetical protein
MLDLRSLALFRVAIGTCLLATLLLRLPQLDAFYTDDGVLPREALIRLRDPFVSLHMISGVWMVQAVLFLIGILFALAFTAGYRTRLSAVVSWVMLTSMQARNPLVAHGGDNVLRVLLFWSMFLPLDGSKSLEGQGRRMDHLSPAGVAFILQICAVYWFAFAEKMDPIWLTERSAVYYTLHLDMFATSLGVGLRDSPELMRLLAVATLALEFLGPLLAISPVVTTPLRLVAVVSFIGFHAGLALTMRLGTFPWICTAAWLALLPGPVWRMWDRRWVPSWTVRPSRLTGRLGSLLVVGAVLIITLGLLAPPLRPPAPNDVSTSRRLLSMMGWTQRWPMFAPHPTTEDGWYVIQGVTAGGGRVDVWGGGTSTGNRPTDFGAAYRDTRWLGYLYLIRSARYESFRGYFGQYLCRAWSKRHGEQIDSISIAFVSERTPPPGRLPLPPERQLLAEQACP